MKKKIRIKIFSFPNLSKREKTIFYIAFVFIFLAILDNFFISPIFSKIKNLNREISDTELKIKNSLKILSQKDRILNEAKKYSTFLISTKTEEEEITSLLQEIESIANKSQLYIVDMKPLPANIESSYIKKYLITLNSEGKMENIVDFIYSIENSNQLLVVEKYQITLKSKETNTAQLAITISKTVIP
jgi:Tfp pilus assembly protein PilO